MRITCKSPSTAFSNDEQLWYDDVLKDHVMKIIIVNVKVFTLSNYIAEKEFKKHLRTINPF